MRPADVARLAADPRYAALPADLLPATESLYDTQIRVLPYWYEVLVPQLERGLTIAVVSHGNTLRPLIAHLDALALVAIEALEVPHCEPLLYAFDDGLTPLVAGGTRLASSTLELSA